eukprot:50119_1
MEVPLLKQKSLQNQVENTIVGNTEYKPIISKPIISKPINSLQIAIDDDDKEDNLCDELQSFDKSKKLKIIHSRLRILIATVIMILIMIFEVHINHYWYISFVWFISLTSLLIFLGYIDLMNRYNKRFDYKLENKNRTKMHIWMLSHFYNNLLKSSKGSTYSCSICWLFDVRNNIGLLYDDRLLWIIAICFDLLLVCQILIYYNFNKKPIHNLCEMIDGKVNNASIESGECMFRKEIGYAWWSVCVVGTQYSLISTIDISVSFIEKLGSVQKKIKQIYKLSHNGTNCVIYPKLTENRDLRKQKLTNQRKYIYAAFILFCLIYSPHLLWYQVFGLTNDLRPCITGDSYIPLFVYLIALIVHIVCPMMTLVILYKIYEIYTDFESITSVFSNTISNKTIRYWWLLRQFYYNYVNVFYFAISNGIYGMALVIDIFILTVSLYWTLWLYLWPRQYSITYVYDYVAFSVFLMAIIFTMYVSLISYHIAFVYPKRQKHIEMLLHLKNKNILNYGNREFHQSIDSLCKMMDKYDTIPTIFGIAITPKKLYLFIAYILTIFSTILSRVLF